MEANRDAPVFAEGRIRVSANPQQLWDIMADFENWPSWNDEVGSVSVKGPVANGTVFRWKTGASTIVSTLRRVEPPHVLGWTGRTMGIRAIHVWRFAASDEETVASMEESFEGALARLFRGRLQRQLDEATTKGLEALKAAAEGRK